MARSIGRRPRWQIWNEDAVALTLRAIHFQDVALTALAVGVKSIELAKYDQFKIYLDIIQSSVENLQKTANDIQDIKRGPGHPPKWRTLADDTEALAGLILRGVTKIRARDIYRNDWAVIIARLTESKHQLIEIQKATIRAMPYEAHPDEVYVSQTSIIEVFESAQVRAMGGGEGRWRNSRD